MDFLLSLLGMVPWPAWAVLALCLICAIQFVWGWKATIAAVTSLLPVLGYLWGRKRQAEIDQARRDREALRDAHYPALWAAPRGASACRPSCPPGTRRAAGLTRAVERRAR